MQIQFPTSFATPLATRAALAWAVNDLLLAEVIGRTDENFTRLAIGDMVVTARTELPLLPGQTLALKVIATGTTTVMQVIESQAEPAAQAVARGLARLLPRQATALETQQLVRALTQLARTPAGVSAQLAPTAAATIERDLSDLMRSLPSLTAVTQPRPLRALVELAALPTEARLKSAIEAQAAPDISTDLRVQFARIGAALATPATHHPLGVTVTGAATPASVAEPATPAQLPIDLPAATPARTQDEVTLPLKELVDSVVARLAANQLQSVPATSNVVVPLIVDLPVVHAGRSDLLHFEFENDDGDGRASGSERGSVTIKLSLDDGHEFTARLQLRGDTLNLRLGASDAEFNHLLLAHVDELAQELVASGLSLNQLVVAPLTVTTRPRLGTHQLINERI